MTDTHNMEKRVVMLRRTVKALDEIKFPTLRRPDTPNGSPPTPELIDWAIRLYCFSLVSHFREMLRSFLLLGDNGRIPAGYVVTRCLYEMGAHAHYVHKHVHQHVSASDLPAAWKLLLEVNMGSRYMREEYADEKDGMPQFAAPREIGKIIRCFDEWTGNKGQAVTEYSFLSEFAHPNMAAFQHYYELKRTPEGSSYAEFTSNFTEAPLPHLSISLVVALHFATKLLELSDETEISSQLKMIITEWSKSSEKQPGQATAPSKPASSSP